MTAFLVTIDSSGGRRRPTKFYHDVYTHYRHDQPVPSGSFRDVPIPHAIDGSDASKPRAVELRAALYADGTTSGYPDGVNDLLQMRRIVLDRLLEVEAVLQALRSRNLPSARVLEYLQWERDFRNRASAGAPIEQRRMHDKAFRLAMLNLGGGLRVNGRVPETTVAIRHMRKFFETWRGELEAAKPTLPAWSPALAIDAAGSEVRMQGVQTRLCGQREGTSTMFRLASWHPTLPQESCTVHDVSTLVPGSNQTCGNQTWTLAANLGGHTYSFGDWTAFGACTGNITDCNGDIESGSVDPGFKHFLPSPFTPPPGDYGFF